MNEAMHESFSIERGAFETAGEASGRIKRVLRQLGVQSQVVRRVSVAAYEVEMNLVIHSLGGQMEVFITPETVRLEVSDCGPGIPDIELAMREGWSTASDEVRTLGFGAGMGLPNMKRNADEFQIQSQVGVGTNISMKFLTK